MNYNLINLAEAEELKKELSELIQEEIVREILNQAKVEEEKNLLQFIFEGHSLKVTASLLPDLYSLCQEVALSLEFPEDIEFYVCSDNSINATAISRVEKSQPHLVVLNSSLIENFDEEELRFVIGHEIGHLITKNSELQRIIDFIFHEQKEFPLIFKHKKRLWEQLTEISADRYGYIASPSLEKCISSFFKLSSGLFQRSINLNIKAYLELIDDSIQKLLINPISFKEDHPINPIRVKALQYFSDSQLWKQIHARSAIEEDQELSKKIGDLIKIMCYIGDSELDNYRAIFIAAGGILIACQDKGISLDEVETIINCLSNFKMFPKLYLDKLMEKENIIELLTNAAEEILKVNPMERIYMLKFVIDIALCDRKINRQEIEFIYNFGEEILKFSKKEIAQVFAERIRATFRPYQIKLEDYD